MWISQKALRWWAHWKENNWTHLTFLYFKTFYAGYDRTKIEYSQSSHKYGFICHKITEKNSIVNSKLLYTEFNVIVDHLFSFSRNQAMSLYMKSIQFHKVKQWINSWITIFLIQILSATPLKLWWSIRSVSMIIENES